MMMVRMTLFAITAVVQAGIAYGAPSNGELSAGSRPGRTVLPLLREQPLLVREKVATRQATCGNSICEADENFFTCPLDCTLKTCGFRDAADVPLRLQRHAHSLLWRRRLRTPRNCSDLPRDNCANKQCRIGPPYCVVSLCPQDCGACNANGICDASPRETFQSCPSDCAGNMHWFTCGVVNNDPNVVAYCLSTFDPDDTRNECWQHCPWGPPGRFQPSDVRTTTCSAMGFTGWVIACGDTIEISDPTSTVSLRFDIVDMPVTVQAFTFTGTVRNVEHLTLMITRIADGGRLPLSPPYGIPLKFAKDGIIAMEALWGHDLDPGAYLLTLSCPECKADKSILMDVCNSCSQAGNPQTTVAQVSCPAGNFNGQELAAPSLRLFGKQWVNTTGTFSCVDTWAGMCAEASGRNPYVYVGQCLPTKPGETCTLECPTGWQGVGNATVSCNSSLVIDASGFSCVGPPCTINDVDPNANASECAGLRADMFCRVYCPLGLQASDYAPLVLYCPETGGEISAADLQCRAATCTLSKVQPRVNATACAGLQAGSSCILTCPRGYQATGPATVECPATGGDVNVRTFSCNPIATCTLSSVKPRVNATACAGLQAGSSCTLTCPRGYQATGPATVECPATGGDVNVKAFSCNPIAPPPTCTLTGVRPDIDVSSCASGFEAGTYCVRHCPPVPPASDPGPYLVMYCPPTGGSINVSAAVLEQCPKATCTLSSVKPRVNATACAGLQAGSSCTLTCPRGYQATGPATVRCPATGGDVNVEAFSCNPIVPPVCMTPWGPIKRGQWKRVRWQRRFCAARRNGRKCGGMWVYCPARGGQYNLRCIY